MTDGTDDVFDGEDEATDSEPDGIRATDTGRPTGADRLRLIFTALGLIFNVLIPVAFWVLLGFESAVIAGLTALLFLLTIRVVDGG